MRGDLRVSTKYIDWALVPSRWIERRFLIFTALRNPGYILLHLVAGPPLAAVVGITVGVLLELVGVPDGNGIWAFVVGALLVASLMGIRLLSFTVVQRLGRAHLPVHRMLVVAQGHPLGGLSRDGACGPSGGAL